MIDFLNISLFEMLLNSAIVQESKYPQLITIMLCILRIGMMWPTMYLLYKIGYNCVYFYDRNKDNSINLRSDRVKRFCYQDLWREFWEAKDYVHGIAPSLRYECGDCTACDKGNERCKNIHYNFNAAKKLYDTVVFGSAVFAFLICNPFSVIRILGSGRGTAIMILAVFINPLFIYFSRLSYGKIIKTGSDKLFIAEKHDDPNSHVYEEMWEDGSLEKYWDTIPKNTARANPNAVCDGFLNGNSANKPWAHYNPVSDALKKQWEAQDLSNASRIANYYSDWWWLEDAEKKHV